MKSIIKLEVSINVIVHATEDVLKFLSVFKEIFEIEEDQFSLQTLRGHYENPITLLKIKLFKKEARIFVKKLMSLSSKEQKIDLFETLKERIERSSLHLRLDKQELVKGKIRFKEKDPIKLKISIPVYKKDEKVETFKELLNSSN